MGDHARMKLSGVGVSERLPLMTLSHFDAAYVADPATFARSWIRGGAIVEGAGGRDGLDREHIRWFWRDLATRVPLLRQRLTPVPFSFAAPVWVTLPSVNIDDHLRFHPTVEPDTPARIAELIGREIPGMDLSRPLWEVLVVPLDSGRVGFLTAVHHVLGDAQAIYPLVESVSLGSNQAEGTTAGAVAGRPARNIAGTQGSAAPRVEPQADSSQASAQTSGGEATGTPPSGAAVVATLAAQWWDRQDSVRSAFRAYRRSNTRERLGLWRDRIVWRTRQLRAQRESEPAVPLAAGLYCVLDVPRIMQRAEHLGVSVSDLVVAATLTATGEVTTTRTRDTTFGGSTTDAAAHASTTDAAASLLVAIAGVRGTEETANNRVWTPTVTVGLGLDFERTTLEVHRQIREALGTASNPPSAATPGLEEAPTTAPTGYATFIELPITDLAIAGGRSTDFVVWPGGDSHDLVNCVAVALGDRLTITVTTGAGIDPADALDTICGLLAP